MVKRGKGNGLKEKRQLRGENEAIARRKEGRAWGKSEEAKRH